MKSVIAFFVTWAVATVLLTIAGFIAPLAAVLALVPAILVAAWTKSSRGEGAPRTFHAKGSPPLLATYASVNLALDLPGRRLWLRDVGGRTMIIDVSDLAAWEHTWTDTSNVWGHRFRIRNELKFRLRQLDMPSVTVRFNRHNDSVSGNRNYEEASQWQARLTTLING
jgi:hypothetical protein